MIFEHRNYLPSMLFFVPISAGLCYLLGHFAYRKRMKYVLCAFIVLLLVGLGHSTFMRNFTWKNTKSLWIDASDKALGDFRVHNNLGKFYQEHGFIELAIEEYKKAVDAPLAHRKGEAFVTHHNLGKLYSDLGDFEKGKSYYETAISMNPNFIPALTNLAAIFDRMGQTESAYTFLQKILDMNPTNEHASLNMGLYHLRRNEPDKALGYLMNIREQGSFEAENLFYLGITYKQTGELGKASAYFQRAVDKEIKTLDAHLHLAEIYMKSNLSDRAEREVVDALELLGSDKESFYRIICRIAELAICAVCYYVERTAKVTGIAVHSGQQLYIIFHSLQRAKPIHQTFITLPGWQCT
jgi:protein O-mannosyl-transferase